MSSPNALLDGVTLHDRPDGELLPARVFSSPAFHEAELEVFERSWVHVADLTELGRPGDFVAASIGRVAVVIVRGQDGMLRGFLNACRHRGAQLAEGTGNCGPTLRCPYHAWSYRTDGALCGVPHREEFDARIDGFGLVPIRVGSVGPLVFGCLDAGAPPLEEWVGDLAPALEAAGCAGMKAAFQFEYDVPVNWKLYVENGLDGYHIEFVHDVLKDLVSRPGEAEHRFERWSSYTLAPISPMLAQMITAAGGPANPRIRFGLVFPNLIPVLSPGELAYLRIDPVGPDRIRLLGRSFDLDDEPARALRAWRAESFDRTNRQDIAVVCRVQRGLAGGRMPPGVHGRMLEARVGHFERLLLRELRAR